MMKHDVFIINIFDRIGRDLNLQKRKQFKLNEVGFLGFKILYPKMHFRNILSHICI